MRTIVVEDGNDGEAQVKYPLQVIQGNKKA